MGKLSGLLRKVLGYNPPTKPVLNPDGWAPSTMKNLEQEVRTQEIDIKQFDIKDVLKAAQEHFGSKVVNTSQTPAEVWVKGKVNIEGFNSFLKKKFASYPGESPQAAILRNQGDVTVLSVGI